MKLLLDEHLSPTLCTWCASAKGIYAAAVAHVGLAGFVDSSIWRYALENDYVIVTSNAKDFIQLLDVEIHPGLIILNESGLAREEQRDRLAIALDYIFAQPSSDSFMINRVIEVLDTKTIYDREIPSSTTR
jgi:predicted nuclease of predicted toxin-antitoxin system